MDISGYIKAILDYHMEPIDGQTILDALYDHYTEARKSDSEEINCRYKELYEAMNGKTLKEIGEIERPVYFLTTSFESRGFKEGVKVGVRLANEVK